MPAIHPFYQTHRSAMQSAMARRIALAAPLLRERAEGTDLAVIGQDIMQEFEIVLGQLPYVGGVASRMSDFFMRLIGFLAMSRVLRRHGLTPAVIGDIEREIYKAQLLTEPEAQRLAQGRAFMSPDNQRFLRAQAALSASANHRSEFPDDFVYDFVAPAPGDAFEFGIDYKACGFCKFAARHGDKEILPNICGLDVDAYAAMGIRLERTQTLAGGASHCNFRFSHQASEEVSR
ncbi:L-2-amino-thiazoline-4-carboxylic acid hydrolase [Bradyrhizobium sp. SRS-191]|uniref:L-2-amino-thiazoline-4-carboxylic acid hydrolase n=1 Tax=Bradyrhizobium sp. SRS-191 TaxID=2962606 RepID=UPI00211F1733|nr:L-2-amino-thiazoline-4-carboxylic acid hydrolase [Bradyrhizobium sp. SRS-191]